MKDLRTIRSYKLLALFSIILAFGSCGDDSPSGGNSNTLPSITAITPTQVSLGQKNVEGKIQGQNLSGVVSVNLGASIQIQNFQSISASEIQVQFSVGRDAQPGARSISITTSAGTANSGSIFTLQNNQVPVPAFTVSPAKISKNVDITFDASRSTDQGGEIASYRWDFGDGKSINGKIVTHKFAKAGTFSVMLSVTDHQQGASSLSRSLVVSNNAPPAARFTISPTKGDTGTEFTMDASESTDRDGRVVRYSWNFGDGQKTEGKVVKHRYKDARSYTVSLTVTDNDDATDFLGRDVQVDQEHVGGGGCHTTLNGVSICSGSDFRGQSFCAVSVSGNVLIANTTLQRCPGKCGEIRRNGDGIREFVGDIQRIDGNRVTLDFGRLPASTRPKAGERLRAIWRPCH